MPLLWLSLAFLSGILLGEYLDWPLVTWLVSGALCLLLLRAHMLLKRLSPGRIKSPVNLDSLSNTISSSRIASLSIPSIPIPLTLLLLALVLGALRYSLSKPTIDSEFIVWYNDRGVDFVVEGVVLRPPDVRDSYSNLRVGAEQISPVGPYPFTSIEGLLLARIPPGENIKYGDRVRLTGSIATPPEDEDFSYRKFLAHKGIYSYMSDPTVQVLTNEQGRWWLSWIYRTKARALETVYRIYPDPEASLLAGILLGVESGIPENVQEAFRDTGTSHIIVISGFNITIIAALLATIFGRMFGKGRKGARWGALAALIGIVIYTILVGGDAAVRRAAIMGGLALFAMQLGRRQDGLNSLAFVAVLMALANPNVLWDVSFQLSFAATLGLVLLAEPFTNTFIKTTTRWIPEERAQRLSGPVGEYLLFTIAATIFTLPVILYHFQHLSLTSLIANPLILPVQPPIMILGGLAVILGMIFQPLGQIGAYLAWPFVVYTIRVVELLARIPGGAITVGRVSLLLVVLFYSILLTWILAGACIKEWLATRQIKLPSKVWAITAAGMVLLTIFVWRAALSAPDGKLHMTLLDVGTGDAILIQSPTGRQLLIDGGPSPSRLSDGLSRRLPLTRRKMDYLVLGAAGDEQLGALQTTVERFQPSSVLWAGPMAASRSASYLRERLIDLGIPISMAENGQAFDLGQGAELEVLMVTERGAVYLLEWGNFRALLPIGLDFDSMEELENGSSLTTVTALLLAESGYAPLNTREWLERWQPTIALLSVQAGDRHGLPDPETIGAVEGYNLLRTDENGWVHLSTDGEQLWVEVEKK